MLVAPHMLMGKLILKPLLCYGIWNNSLENIWGGGIEQNRKKKVKELLGGRVEGKVEEGRGRINCDGRT